MTIVSTMKIQYNAFRYLRKYHEKSGNKQNQKQKPIKNKQRNKTQNKMYDFVSKNNNIVMFKYFCMI